MKDRIVPALVAGMIMAYPLLGSLLVTVVLGPEPLPA